MVVGGDFSTVNIKSYHQRCTNQLHVYPISGALRHEVFSNSGIHFLNP